MDLSAHLLKGHVIPALPLMLHADRTWSERHQRAVIRYYMASGSGGLAVGVHSTQFAIREPRHGLFQPVLELAKETMDEVLSREPRDFVRIAGLCGRTPQAMQEAELARGLGYHAGLLSPGAWPQDPEESLLQHCREVSQVLPLIGFYLQTAVGGRVLSYRFWRAFAEIPGVVAVKIAPFNRYHTFDVVRAVLESGREDIALYTGNDDNIVNDLLTPWQVNQKTRFISGGLLGQWGVWTERAVQMLEEIKLARTVQTVKTDWLTTNAALTDANAAVFDAANGFAGCIPGILEVLRRQGLAPSTACLDPHETLSPGQAEELTRVSNAWPQLTDDAFVEAHRDEWLA